MKYVFLVLLNLMLILPASGRVLWAGACDTGEAIHEERKIHGPANIRDKPNGKVVASLPMGFEVLALKNLPFKNSKGKESYWFYIQWTRKGKTHNGWTHEQNIICD